MPRHSEFIHSSSNRKIRDENLVADHLSSSGVFFQPTSEHLQLHHEAKSQNCINKLEYEKPLFTSLILSAPHECTGPTYSPLSQTPSLDSEYDSYLCNNPQISPPLSSPFSDFSAASYSSSIGSVCFQPSSTENYDKLQNQAPPYTDISSPKGPNSLHLPSEYLFSNNDRNNRNQESSNGSELLSEAGDREEMQCADELSLCLNNNAPQISWRLWIDDIIAEVRAEISAEQSLFKNTSPPVLSVLTRKLSVGSCSASMRKRKKRNDPISTMEPSNSNSDNTPSCSSDSTQSCAESGDDYSLSLEKRAKKYSLSKLSDEQVAKRKQEQNRKAAQRYRMRKTLNQASERIEIYRLEEINKELRAEEMTLRTEIERLKRLLISSSNNSKIARNDC